jgi:hypothetical protein
MAAQHRNRPSLAVTLDPENVRRLRAVVDRLPMVRGPSALIDEMLTMTLPAFEQIADIYQQTLRPDGTSDLALAQERMATFVGAQLFGLMEHNKPPKGDEPG